MTRVFPGLVIAVGILFVANGVLGFCVNETHLYPQHFILGFFTVVMSVLVHVVVFTYFAAGGKMVSQAVLIGHLDQEPLSRIRHHKRRVTRCIGCSFLSLIALVIFGALFEKDPSWQWWHVGAVVVAILTNAVSFYVQYDHIAQNARTTEAVFRQYDAARRNVASRNQS